MNKFWITDHYTWKLSKIALLYLCNVLHPLMYLEGSPTTCIFIDSVRHWTPNLLIGTSLPTLCLFSFSAEHAFVRIDTIWFFCFVSWSEGLYWHVCSFGICYLLINIYKFLIKDVNWHALPIDEYLQNFQLKMLIKYFQLKLLKLIKNKKTFVRDILCVPRTIQ